MTSLIEAMKIREHLQEFIFEKTGPRLAYFHDLSPAEQERIGSELADCLIESGWVTTNENVVDD